jgi:hypothetical protein
VLGSGLPTGRQIRGRRKESRKHQVGAGDPPSLAGGVQGLVAAVEFGARPHHVHVGEYPFAPGRELLRPADHFFRPAKGIHRPGQLAARLLHVEVGLGHCQQAIIPRDL